MQHLFVCEMVAGDESDIAEDRGRRHLVQLAMEAGTKDDAME